MREYAEVFVGLDVARAKHAVAIADEGRTREVRNFGEIAADAASVRRMVKKLKRASELDHRRLLDMEFSELQQISDHIEQMLNEMRQERAVRESYKQTISGPLTNIARTFASGQTASLQATFTEVFDLDANVASGYAGVPASALYNSAGTPVVDVFGNYVLTS